MSATKEQITNLLVRAREGNRRAADELVLAVYGELRGLAARYLQDQRSDHTLQPTALVHEAYLRLVGSESWASRAHFYRVAAKAMRSVLVDHARKRRAGKREGLARKVRLTEGQHPSGELDIDLLALDEALSKLASFDPRKNLIVELRFFGGLTAEEVARVIEVTPRTVERQWRLAKAWLFQELRDGGSGPAS